MKAWLRWNTSRETTKMKKLAFYGAGGHGFAALELARSTGEFEPVIFYDDSPSLDDILGVKVLSSPISIPYENLCVSIGDNKNRKKVATNWKLHFPSLIHPSVSKYESSKVGEGTLILPQVVLDAGAVIGNFCIINNHATISHNVSLEDFVHVAINAAICGGVKIGEGSLIGAGAVILPDVTVGKWSIVGAGAVVTKNIPDYTTVIGNPAIGKSHIRT